MAVITPPARIGAYAPGVSPKPAGKPRKPAGKLRKSPKPKPVMQPLGMGLINR
jgi:hypothetical protein